MPLCDRFKSHHYKLTYFDLRGRAEVVRLLLAAAGQKFEDERVEGKQWGPMRSSRLGVVLWVRKCIEKFPAYVFRHTVGRTSGIKRERQRTGADPGHHPLFSQPTW